MCWVLWQPQRNAENTTEMSVYKYIKEKYSVNIFQNVYLFILL